MRGPDNSLRVRQVRTLGHGPCRSYDPMAINQQVCENETLRVFRLLTSQVSRQLIADGTIFNSLKLFQVFGRLISKDEDLSTPQAKPSLAEDGDRDEDTRDIDLKEHMVCCEYGNKE